MTDAPERMSDERLDRMRKWVAAVPDGTYTQHTTGADACKSLLAHIDAQAARIAELTKPVEDVEVASLIDYCTDREPGGNHANMTLEREAYKNLADALYRLARENATLKLERDAIADELRAAT
jgi:hypothetical protein